VSVAFIEFRNVSFTYPGQDRPALDRVSFSLEEGCHTALVGGNGSGKSTLARLLIGLLEPQEGEILVDGLDTRIQKNHRTIRSKAGLVFQDPSSQIVATVVREDAAFGPENLVLDSAEIQKRVEEALESVSISPLSRRGTHQLSAGQQQRLGMAGVLALGSRCLVLDEAESMLNPEGRKQLNTLLARLHGEGHSVLRITHFMDQAVCADRVMVLNEGRLAADGDPSLFIREREKLASWHLRETPVQELCRQLAGVFPGFPDFLKEEDLTAHLRREGYTVTLPPRLQKYSPPDSGISAELRGVHRVYGKKSGRPVTALRDLNFSLRKGESVSVLGQTGSGKSTFLQILNTLLLPDSGSITLLGENPMDKKTDLQALRSRIGLVMQQPEKQLFARLVGDDVAFGPSRMGVKGKALSLRVKEALDQVGLPFDRYRDYPVKALSGGQKRKAALAGILAMRPEILLLDEPTAGLDPLAAESMENILINLQKEGITLVLVTHNVEQALRFSRRLAVFRDGTILRDGDGAVFFQNHNPAEGGMDYPLAGRIAAALHKDAGGSILSADDLIASLTGRREG